MANYFSKNLKYLREKRGISQNKLAEKVGVNQTTIKRWEDEEIKPSIDNVEEVANALNIELPDLLIKDLTFDNGQMVDIDSDVVYIPVLGVIKAGLPIEAQQYIEEQISIPKKWTRGGKKFYGLKKKGDSMYPKYKENDIVIFEQTEDCTIANKKDCAVMVNGYDATFKNFTITEKGITLVPLNPNNSENYQPTFYNREQVINLPVKVIGIARKKITDIE